MIYGCIGRGGTGKSLTTVRRLWRLYRAGRDIISNTPLVDLRVWYDAGLSMWRPVDPVLFGQSWACGYIKTFEEVGELDECDVFLDEFRSWMPKSQEKDMGDEMMQFIAQDRREGVNIHWTHRTAKVWVDVKDNTAEIAVNMKYGPLIVQTVCDPQEPKEKWKRFDFVSSRIFDLYQTFARVGSGSTGEGYGLGKRKGYKSGGATGELITVTRWGPHSLDLKVRPNQWDCLVRKFGPEALGVRRIDHGMIPTWVYPGRNAPSYIPPPKLTPFDIAYHRKEEEI